MIRVSIGDISLKEKINKQINTNINWWTQHDIVSIIQVV